MKPSRDRLHRVLVVGATPAGLAAVTKLGEMGVPVTFVSAEPDLDEAFCREQWRLASGLTLNHALRPGILRVLRNPAIRCIVPGEVLSIKHTPQGFRARIRRRLAHVDPDRCVLCGRCAEVCPVVTPDGTRPIEIPGRGGLPGRPIMDRRRRPPCQIHCPLGVRAQGYIALASRGRFQEALDLVREDNVLPSVCGRVCTHPCELACRRQEVDEPLDIRHIKRFLADRERGQQGIPQALRWVSGSDKRVAVVGSGPAGLAAAADLARLGYRVTVLERERMVGGLLRYAIGPHRLPREALDYDIDFIKALGVAFRTSSPIRLDEDLGRLRREYDAVVVATGMWRDRPLEVPGQDLAGVEGCVAFLSRLYRDGLRLRGENVAVIGDGNAAFEAARTLVRLGARATVVSWFPESLVPADPDEVREALEEGVALVERAQVIAFLGENGKLSALRCAPTRPGEPDAQGIPWPVVIPGAASFEIPCDRAVVSIGQSADTGGCGGLPLEPGGTLRADDHGWTGIEGVFVAGDAVTGPSSVVEAMASGRRAALGVHRALGRERVSTGVGSGSEEPAYPDIPGDVPSVARAGMPRAQVQARIAGFSEVALGLSESQVIQEAVRCLQCGVCSDCLQCLDACKAVEAIDFSSTSTEELVEQAGVVIAADAKAMPAIRGEDVIRAYGTKAVRTDVYAMIMRGFAAAAQAVIMLGGTSQRQRGHGLSFTPPALQLAREIRMGVFLCRCNDAQGWDAEIEEYARSLLGYPDVVHVEVLMSACTPEGTARIIRAVRGAGLTRMVLGSCVCCPLDFICSACTDQRSRLKDQLFSATGINRAMVETCNIRGEALRHLKADRGLALDRLKGLVKRAVNRARYLKPLPSPARPYNFTTAVIGRSEAAVTSAITLAELGMEVLFFGGPERGDAEPPAHPNIANFADAVVYAVGGTLGDFQVHANAGGERQIFQVGAVVLGERSRRRFPYVGSDELPGGIVSSAMQRAGQRGVPFFYPGATSIAGLYVADPAGINVSARTKGAAAAILAAAVMPRGPRQNKGYTVVVDQERCRGCGRCIQVCPYQAVSFQKNRLGGWCAVVDEGLCKGCGNCISICPSNAADSPYRDQRYLERIIEEILISPDGGEEEVPMPDDLTGAAEGG